MGGIFRKKNNRPYKHHNIEISIFRKRRTDSQFQNNYQDCSARVTTEIVVAVVVVGGGGAAVVIALIVIIIE